MAGVVNTGYAGGGSFTNASGPAGMDVSPYLAALLERERQHMQQKTAAPAGGSPLKMNTTYAPPPPSASREGGSTMNRLQEQLLKAQVSQERAKAKALSGPAPMKLHPGGAGYTSAFSQMDPLQMTGAQRAQFLPQSSGLVSGGDSGGGGGSPRAQGRAAPAASGQYAEPFAQTVRGSGPTEYHYNAEAQAHNQALDAARRKT